MSAYETCWYCNGSGMQDYGEYVGSCSECRGDTVVRARDDRGRFISYLQIETRRKEGNGR